MLAMVACSPPPPTGAQLVVYQERVEPLSAIYTEGAIAYLEVRDADGDVAYAARTGQYLQNQALGSAELDPGTYEIRSYIQSCSGTCDLLDPPSDACAMQLVVEPGQTHEVVIQRDVGKPCQMAEIP
jgi:hypothetical protein